MENTVSLTSDTDQILLLLISFHLSKFVPVNDKFSFLFPICICSFQGFRLFLEIFPSVHFQNFLVKSFSILAILRSRRASAIG